MRSFIIFPLLALAACNGDAAPDAQSEETAPAAATPADAEPAEQEPEANSVDGAFLDGVWAFEGDYCASGAPVRFFADGRYSDFDSSGNWTVSGNEMTVRFDDGTQNTLEIERVDENEMITAGTRARRCPANGGEEPWHPGQTFTTD
tara:strand:+ start:1199 stop:1639 length:441 start_codon:yes stop_codon:yes gene_type:complete